MEALAEQPLAPLYYRDNFLRLIDTVRQQYGDLLNAEEHDFLARFDAASVAAQCLFVRLISRTGPDFRASKLRYPEIPELPQALTELKSAGLIIEQPELSLEAVFALFTRPELDAMFAKALANHPRPASKPALFEQIDAQALDAQTLRYCREQVDPRPIVTPCGIEHVQLFQVLFFGNRYQSLTQFVLEDLGVTRFYPYALHPEHRLFSCREALDEYLTCAGLADARYQALEAEDDNQLVALSSVLTAQSLAFETTRPRWDKLCNRLGRDLERRQQWDDALAVYALANSYPTRERIARIHEKTGNLPQALALCDEVLADPINEAEKDAASTIRPRVLCKLAGTRNKRIRDTFETLELQLEAGEESVERLTAAHLASQWASVHYVENRLMNALFGLAFWDIIFADIPGVFHHPFQRGPTDMYEADFRRRRKPAITERLATLATGNLEALLLGAYDNYEGFSNHWVDWRGIGRELVSAATQVIPTEHLLAIWERMLFDPRENRRGFPDLIAFGQSHNEYAMIEVKGPGDALQDNQKRWLRFFHRNAIPAQVAWVTWKDTPEDA